MRGDEIIGMVTRRDFLTAIANLSLDAVGYSDADDHFRKSVIAAKSHASWRPCGLNVSVHDGIVTLQGTIKSDNACKAAIIAAENIAGVKGWKISCPRSLTRRRKRTMEEAISSPCRKSLRPPTMSHCRWSRSV